MIVSSLEEPEHLSNIKDYMTKDWKPLFEKGSSIDSLLKHIDGLEKDGGYESSLKSYKTFLPPRLISAAKEGKVSPFFGAGVSIAAGIPTWGGLLSKLGVTEELANEPNLEHDPLTLAELLAHEIGYLELQKELRKLMSAHVTPSIVHYLLAQLSQGVYVTTNYDTLFESAWKVINNNKEPMVITTDSDFVKYGLEPKQLLPKDGNIVLLKIHGCASRQDEELILTRSQYRRHYRTNIVLFEAVRNLMLHNHMLFLGFSHSDPEITRLVDDVIHEYERNTKIKAPEYYSLQFDMKEKTPEVFAARGILALRPPVSLDIPDNFNYRTAGLSKALIDMCGAMDSDIHESLNIDRELHDSVTDLENDLSQAMAKVEEAVKEIEKDINNNRHVQSCTDALLNDLDSLAGQGVYLLKKNGDISVCSIPNELKNPERNSKKGLSDRFYVQQAKTFKEAFVSDSDKSIFNGHSTVFLCATLGTKKNYEGLLFCATQIGEWEKPIRIKEEFLKKYPDASLILVDSNGVVLLPPNDEIDVKSPTILSGGETGIGNQGYEYDQLHRISRRDLLITRVWRNIVPLYQDDDVYNFSDLGIYSVVSEVKGTRWKLALSKPI